MCVRTEVNFAPKAQNLANTIECTLIFRKNAETTNGNLGRLFSKIYRIEEAPASMLTGIELFQHRFSGNPENH